MNNTEIIDNPFLELSQSAEAMTARELKLQAALERIYVHDLIMGSTGDFREGQLAALRAVSTIAWEALVDLSKESQS